MAGSGQWWVSPERVSCSSPCRAPHLSTLGGLGGCVWSPGQAQAGLHPFPSVPPRLDQSIGKPSLFISVSGEFPHPDTLPAPDPRPPLHPGPPLPIRTGQQGLGSAGQAHMPVDTPPTPLPSQGPRHVLFKGIFGLYRISLNGGPF